MRGVVMGKQRWRQRRTRSIDQRVPCSVWDCPEQDVNESIAGPREAQLREDLGGARLRHVPLTPVGPWPLCPKHKEQWERAQLEREANRDNK